MLQYLQGLYHLRKDFISFFILTYLDKAISFMVPLSILLILNDKAMYADVEVIFSYSIMASVLVELGFTNYLFFGYRESAKRAEFIGNAQTYFAAYISIYAIIILAAFTYLQVSESSTLLMFAYVACRTIFVFFSNFYSSIYRLVDKPTRVYLATISLNLASFLLVMISNYFDLKSKELTFFFLPSMLLILVIAIRFIIRLRLFSLMGFHQFAKAALIFSWPIILNVLAMSFISNYAKIYAYGNLTEQEMVQVSYVLRLTLIVQLSHTAFANYFSKSIYMDPERKFNYRIFSKYCFVLFISVLLIGVIITVSNTFFLETVYVPFDLTTMLFLTFALLTCCSGFLELYYGVMNANRQVLIYSLTSSGVYIVLLRIFGNVGMFQLAIFMALVGAINLGLMISGLYRLNVFSTSAKSS